MPVGQAQMLKFSEQDTADKLILPVLAREYGFPNPNSMDYQAQRMLPILESHLGRYDGLYLHGGYPYVVLEAKKWGHDLNEEDFRQARRYAVSDDFDEPVPFLIVSNGKEYRFFRKTTEREGEDGKNAYVQITPTLWKQIVTEKSGRVRVVLTPDQLVSKLREMKIWIYRDLRSLFYDPDKRKYDPKKSCYLKDYLEKIIEERKIYIKKEKTPERQIDNALQTIALHFTIKVLFIKIVEDLSSGADTPRIIHELFPRDEYLHLGGIFGFKALYALKNGDVKKALRLYAKTKRFYSKLGEDIAKLTYRDIFLYGFRIHTNQYGQLLSARHYDRFLPSSETLRQIREELIGIDIRNALVYAGSHTRQNVLGDIYGKLIDQELRDSIGAVYTPDHTVNFMVRLGLKCLGKLRGKKVVEPACGSGHFYRLLYRKYVDEVVADHEGLTENSVYLAAHSEALEHVLGKDIDPFAIQLTLLGIFLEQLKDNVLAKNITISKRNRLWKANDYVDCQNSLDPITIHPDRFADVEATLDPNQAKSLLQSCKRALNPDLIIGNPPYGVEVVKRTLYDTVYHLQSKDSYGYFISNAIDRLLDGKRVIFITSSSFLTIKSHFKLRQLILDTCKIVAHPTSAYVVRCNA